MGVISGIIEAIKSAFRWLTNIIITIIRGVLSFAREVVGWFKRQFLDPETDVPFLADVNKFKEQLHNAPVRNVGIFEGVYDEETDEIKACRCLDADEIDADTKKVLGDEELVVLS